MPVNIPTILPFKRHYLSATLSKFPISTITVDSALSHNVEYHSYGALTHTANDPALLDVGDEFRVVQVVGVVTINYGGNVYNSAAPASGQIGLTRFIVIDVGGNNEWSLMIDDDKNTTTFVDLTTNQTIGGTKTFSNQPVIPDGSVGTDIAKIQDISPIAAAAVLSSDAVRILGSFGNATGIDGNPVGSLDIPAAGNTEKDVWFCNAPTPAGFVSTVASRTFFNEDMAIYLSGAWYRIAGGGGVNTVNGITASTVTLDLSDLSNVDVIGLADVTKHLEVYDDGGVASIRLVDKFEANLLSSIDLTNGGLNNLTNVIIPYNSAWDIFTTLKFQFVDVALSPAGLAAFGALIGIGPEVFGDWETNNGTATLIAHSSAATTGTFGFEIIMDTNKFRKSFHVENIAKAGGGVENGPDGVILTVAFGSPGALGITQRVSTVTASKTFAGFQYLTNAGALFTSGEIRILGA